MEWQEVRQCIADKTAVKYKYGAQSFAIYGIDDSKVYPAWSNSIEPINIEEYDQGW